MTELINNKNIIIVIVIFVWFIILLLSLIFAYYNNPFELPVMKIKLDVSNKRLPDHIEYIEQWIINNKDVTPTKLFESKLKQWDEECLNYLDNKVWLFKKHKTEMYNGLREIVLSDCYTMFCFQIIRKQTRYSQVNYVKYPYVVENIENEYRYTTKQLEEVYNKLKDINFETTLTKYFSKSQRKLVTKEMKKKVMLRDNYTCQICGKYMPDEVGLHIDHIVSIHNGGKSVMSNLQVLCDKCNYKKGSKNKLNNI